MGRSGNLCGRLQQRALISSDVPATDAFSRSRPALFGAHVNDPAGLTVMLTPIDEYDPEGRGNLGCASAPDDDDSPSVRGTPPRKPPHDWAALVKRGSCSFATKVRRAQHLGAVAVIVGDFETHDNDPLGTPPLIQMWARDADDLDSVTARFVSAPTYADLLALCAHGPVQIVRVVRSARLIPKVLSREEQFDWALSDLLVVRAPSSRPR